MKLSRQTALVRDHLFSAPHLTSWQAEGVYRIRRLASRISELKNAGYDIVKERMEDATGQPYTRYAFSKRQRRNRLPINPAVESAPRYTLDQIAGFYLGYVQDDLGICGAEADADVSDFVAFIKERA